MNLDHLKWEPVEKPDVVDPELPYVTHLGMLRLGDVEIEVYQLSNGQRIIDPESLRFLFGEVK